MFALLGKIGAVLFITFLAYFACVKTGIYNTTLYATNAGPNSFTLTWGMAIIGVVFLASLFKLSVKWS